MKRAVACSRGGWHALAVLRVSMRASGGWAGGPRSPNSARARIPSRTPFSGILSRPLPHQAARHRRRPLHRVLLPPTANAVLSPAASDRSCRTAADPHGRGVGQAPWVIEGRLSHLPQAERIRYNRRVVMPTCLLLLASLLLNQDSTWSESRPSALLALENRAQTSARRAWNSRLQTTLTDLRRANPSGAGA